MLIKMSDYGLLREDLENFSNARKVAIGEPVVSELPLYSEGYVFCNAYVLKHHNLLGLSHMVPFSHEFNHLKEKGIDKYTKTLDDMLAHFPPNVEVRGMPVGSEPEYLEIMKKCMQDKGIIIADEFEPTMWDYPKGEKRDILIPNSGNEVWIYIRSDGRKIIKSL
jgi:hypothetical protein